MTGRTMYKQDCRLRLVHVHLFCTLALTVRRVEK